MTRTTTHADHSAAAASPGELSTGRACCGPSCCAEPAEAEPHEAPGAEGLVAAVRERYEAIAEGRLPSCCGLAAGDGAAGGAALALGYSAEDLAALPDGANLDLGCGAPLQFLALQLGETVLDLGSGAGVDALLAARRVGAGGRVIGVDMTPAMLARARDNAAAAGFGNVEFRAGRLEALPLGNDEVDAVTSNCVINLVPDKAAVFAEIARVLRPGGRLVISDIVLDAPLPAALENDLLAYVGCVAGALQREAYFAMVRAAGLGDLEVLRDVDYLAALAAIDEHLPAELLELAERAGVAAADLAGAVRSVTFRARRPLAAS
jgi:arsenite methyltransferase